MDCSLLMKPSIRAFNIDDVAEVLQINRGSQPGVTAMTAADLLLLVGLSEFSKVILIQGAIVGYMLVMRKGVDYDGDEYRWFFDNINEDFFYIDQIAIAGSWRRKGLSVLLYRALKRYALRQKIRVFACEINIQPPNQTSMALHKRLGFVSVSKIAARGNTTSLMIKRNVDC